jgi:transposase-like protein
VVAHRRNRVYTDPMNGREKITPKDRRDIILAVLFEGEPQTVLARQYGLDKSHVSRLVSEARRAPYVKLQEAAAALEEAEREVRFRRRVIEILADTRPPRSWGEKETK